jgi:ATP-dependent Clp protease adaptor protein ClpS
MSQQAITETESEPVVAPTRREKKRVDPKPRRQPRYQVVLWDDNEHTYAYVIRMLSKLFGFPPTKAYQMAKEVDTQGRVVLLVTTLEHAELKRDQIHAFGKDDAIAGCLGSMWATVEKIEDA